MKVEVTILISALSLLIALIVAIVNIRNSNSTNDRQAATQITTLIVKLESIAEGINEIKSDMRNVKSDVQDLRERLVLVEHSANEAHHRIDTLMGKE